MSANFRRRYITDFGRVEGVPGVYMANQLSLDLLHDAGNFHPVNYEKFLKSKVGYYALFNPDCLHFKLLVKGGREMLLQGLHAY